MSEIVKFNCDKFSIIKDDPRFIVCRFYFGLVGENANGSVLEFEDYEANKNTVPYTPICGYFSGSDFKEHDKKEYPLGTILSSEDCEYSYEECEDGKKYAVATGIIQKEYLNAEAENILKSGNKKVSLEIEVFKKEKLSNGKFRFKEWIYQCITILGDKYKQGMGQAHLEVLNPRESYASFCKGTIEAFAKQDIDSKFQLGDSVTPTELHMPEHEGKIGVISEVRNGYYYAIKFSDIDEQHEWYSEDELKIADKENFSVGDELGKSDLIEIDNSEDSAIKSGSWDGQDAGFLDKLLKAKNHKSLINEAYARVDGDVSDDLSVNDVGYPHHELSSGKLVLSIPGVSAAYKRAKQQNESGEIMSHIEGHRKALGLDKENFKESEVDKVIFNKEEFTQKFGLTANQLRDSMNEACNNIKYKSNEYEYVKYWVSDYDSKYAYSYDYELNKYVAIPYVMEDGKSVLDFEKVKMAKTIQTWLVEGEEGEMPETCMIEELLAKILEKVSAEKVDFAAKVESEKETVKTEFSQEKEIAIETIKAEFAIQLDEKQNSIVSLGTELDGLKEQFSTKETEIETFKSEVETFKNENETLKSDMAKFAKEKKETLAEVILSKFAKKISEDERKELFGKLETFSTVEDFEKEVKAFVCDKYESETKGKKEFTTYSRMSVITTTDVKSAGTHWTDYINDYKQEK